MSSAYEAEWPPRLPAKRNIINCLMSHSRDPWNCTGIHLSYETVSSHRWTRSLNDFKKKSVVLGGFEPPYPAYQTGTLNLLDHSTSSRRGISPHCFFAISKSIVERYSITLHELARRLTKIKSASTVAYSARCDVRESNPAPMFHRHPCSQNSNATFYTTSIVYLDYYLSFIRCVSLSLRFFSSSIEFFLVS